MSSSPLPTGIVSEDSVGSFWRASTYAASALGGPDVVRHHRLPAARSGRPSRSAPRSRPSRRRSGRDRTAPSAQRRLADASPTITSATPSRPASARSAAICARLLRFGSSEVDSAASQSRTGTDPERRVAERRPTSSARQPGDRRGEGDRAAPRPPPRPRASARRPGCPPSPRPPPRARDAQAPL